MSQTQIEYWRAFERFLAVNAIGMNLRSKPGSDYFRIIEIPGVAWTAAHLAVVATERDSGVRLAGNRVQLVLMPPRAESLFSQIAAVRGGIERQIGGLVWLDQSIGKPSHLEVHKSANLREERQWIEDFAWLAGNAMLFERVLQPILVRALPRG